MRSDQPSLTASLVATIRGIYTELPEPYRLASDPLAAELVPGWLRAAVKGARIARGGAPLVHDALSIATFGLNLHVELRTRAIDDALREGVARGLKQVVLLGAGLDMRALRIRELAGARVFEVDHPSTQRYKVARLASLDPAPRLIASDLVRVAVDFERERIEDALPAAGFDRDAPSFWIWEGVTLYLTREAIAATIRAVASLSAPSSRFALTYPAVRGDRVATWAFPLARRALSAIGEPIRSEMGRDEFWAMLEANGFAYVADDAPVDWARRYYGSDRFVRLVERLAVAERGGRGASAAAA